MTQLGLTEQQREVHRYLRGYLKEHDGISPTFDEIKDALGLRSKSGISRLIAGLEERGLVVRAHKKARSLRLVEDGIGAVRLAPAIEDRFTAECQRRGDDPADVIQDLITLWLDESEDEVLDNVGAEQ